MRQCAKEGCDRPVRARSLCKSHYNVERERAIHAVGVRFGPDRCVEPDCDHPVRERGRCSLHYPEWWAQRRRARLPAGPDPAYLDLRDRLVARLGEELGRSEAQWRYRVYWLTDEEHEAAMPERLARWTPGVGEHLQGGTP